MYHSEGHVAKRALQKKKKRIKAEKQRKRRIKDFLKESTGTSQELPGKERLQDSAIPEGSTPVPVSDAHLISSPYILPGSTGNGDQSKRSLALREKLVVSFWA